jgi:uncharacterized protein
MSNDPNTAPEAPANEPAPPKGGNDENTMGMLAHLLGIFTGFIGPLVIFLMKKDTGGFAAGEAKEALNFQITLAICYLPCIVLSCIPIIGLIFSLGIVGIWIAGLVFSILGTLAANNGQPYRYPIAIRLVK